ncbi:GTP-binding protein, partial [Leptolyngbya sp. FACHB-1624]
LDRALEIDPNFLGEDAHEHDETVTSVAIVESGALDGETLNAWLGRLLRYQGQDIFRMKGILNIAGEDHRFVFQGVHMLFDGKPDRLWKPNEARKNELVFIGRNLDETALKEDFRACLVPTQN